MSVVSERLAEQAGSLEPLGPDACRYVTPAEEWGWLALTVAMVGVPYTVESPSELVERTRALAARITAAAGGP